MTGWDGFAKYVGVQGILALMIGSAIVALLLMGKPVQTEVWAAFTFVLGFYFGQNGRAIVASVKSAGQPAVDE